MMLMQTGYSLRKMLLPVIRQMMPAPINSAAVMSRRSDFLPLFPPVAIRKYMSAKKITNSEKMRVGTCRTTRQVKTRMGYSAESTYTAILSGVRIFDMPIV